MKSLKTVHRNHLLLALLPLIAAVAGGYLFRAFVVHAILTNVILNGVILGTALVGAALMLWRIQAIGREWKAFERFAAGSTQSVGSTSAASAPQRPQKLVAARLLAHLERARRQDPASESGTLPLQEELEDVHRVLESRQEAAQYIVGLMIALGLLGTFIGLLETLVAVGNLIGGFANADQLGDVDQALAKLITNLQYPLTAMGTAFSASMFGLLCSLMLGFMMLSVRSFQVEFLQYARNVVDRVTADLADRGAAAGLGGMASEDAAWSVQRLLALQETQQRLHDEVRQLTLQARDGEARQQQLMGGLERLLSVVERNETHLADGATHLASLPALAQKAHEVSRAMNSVLEAWTQEQRQAAVQHQGLAHHLVQQMGEFAAQVDRGHAEQARQTQAVLVGLLDQRLAAIDAHGVAAVAAQRAVQQQHESLERVLVTVTEAGSDAMSLLRHLQETAQSQTQALHALSEEVASSAREASAASERLGAALTASRTRGADSEIAYEVAQACERIERELRAGIGAVLVLQRQSMSVKPEQVNA